MKFCGPLLSKCCLLVSIWGIIQLGLMGLFFYIHSLTFIEDLGLHHAHSVQDLFERSDKMYTSVAYNCWIAACMYIITLIISVWQAFLNDAEAKAPPAPKKPRYSAPPSPVLPGAISRGNNDLTTSTVIVAETSFVETAGDGNGTKTD